jgi:octaprenyl-diphosphate synthase
VQRFAATKKEAFANESAREIFSPIAHELALVEKEFEAQAESNIQVINYLGDYLRSSGGKRVRPALFILTNYAVGGDGASERSIRMATVMEMLHTATLVHDDIIDNADVRRNRPSINARFGNQTAVLMGDWLYMSAFHTSLRERSLEVLDILTELTRKMTEGELIQMTIVGDLGVSEEDYFDVLRRKTAYLFSACCEIGVIIGAGTQDQQAAMRDFGMDLGIAFQLFDDILDLTAESNQLGKAAGSDLLEGKLTLPLIKLLAADPSLKNSLERVMLDGDYDAISRHDIRRELGQNAILEDIRSIAQAHIERARKNLAVLSISEYRSCLEETINFVTARSS